MAQFIAGISIVCFAASYTVALALEVSRLFFRAPIRMGVLVAFASVGLATQTVYLGRRAFLSEGVPFSSWYDWCLMAAWVVTAVYLSNVVRRPEGSFGLFMLPLVLSLILVAYAFRHVEPFGARRALALWVSIHGIALLLGTAIVTLGFAAGVMFLVQSYRLKHKMPPSERLRLPSLERLQWANERSLIWSTACLMVGLLSGVIMNVIRSESNAIAWSDPVIWSSGVLLLWLIASLIFNAFYKPARRGRKVAYLVVASFIFLGLELGVVLISQHAVTNPEGGGTAPETVMLWREDAA